MTAPATATELEAAPFDLLDEANTQSDPTVVIDALIDHLESNGAHRPLLDALLLKARHELGLPLIQVGPLAEIPEPARTQYEERYVAAIRQVGRRLLDTGDIANAWPYFRAISEPELVAQAIEAYVPIEGDERLGQIVEVAFNHGVAPRKGFELILSHYGTCSAISAYDALPQDESIRIAAAAALVANIHEQLVVSLRAEITRRGQPQPPKEATIADLIADRAWIFDDDAYHLDVSHLAAIVRMSTVLTDRDTLGLALQLTDYGRNLSGRHRYEGDPPFDDTYADHAVYLRGLLGDGAAVDHFRAKIALDDSGEAIAAQVLVRLLARMERLDEAVDTAAEYLGGIPENMLMCPSLSVLCQRTGKLDRLAKSARDHGDLVHYAAAILQGRSI